MAKTGPQKFFELTPNDWPKGLSIQPTLAVGGLFQTASFNPFEKLGVVQPPLEPASVTVSDTPKLLTGWQASGTSYVYAQGASKLYQVLADSPFTTTDVSTEVTLTDGAGTVTGTSIYRNRYIYSLENETYSNTLPAATASEVKLIGNARVSGCEHPHCIGPDGNLYIGDGDWVLRRTDATTVYSGTHSDYRVFTLDVGMRIRDLATDGRYLIMMADNNVATPADRVVGNYKCKIYFWDLDTTQTTSQVVWTINDSYIIGGRFFDGALHFFTNKGFYVCNLSTDPKLIALMTGNSTLLDKPASYMGMTVSGNTLYWTTGNERSSLYSGAVWAYGSPIGGKKTFFQPYYTSGNQHTAILAVGDTFFLGGDANKLWVLNTGSTRAVTTIQSTVQSTPLMRFSYAKVYLHNKLTTDQGFTFLLNTGDESDVICNTVTKSHTLHGAKRVFTITREPFSTGSVFNVDEFSSFVVNMSLTGASVERVELYGEPVDPTNQNF